MFCENEEQLKQLSNRDERVVQNNEKPKENKVVRRSFYNIKMEHIEFLKEVAQELGQQNILNSLNAIQERASQQNANLLIPLVGEFSSGKTTLLNALTDSKNLKQQQNRQLLQFMKSILDVISVRRMLSCQMDKSLILMIWENLK